MYQLVMGKKQILVAYLLLMLFGYVGGHRIYLEKYCTAVLYMLTFGFLGIGVLFDCILLPELVVTHNRKVKSKESRGE